jgi:CubicO group peptidase (beta-lactamase class C family)
LVTRELRRIKAPGCSIALVGPRGDIAARGYGMADLRSSRLAEASTIYHLFSVTKLFTATRVMQLVQGGELNLDAPIADFVPGAPSDVTIEHLLSHTSGLRDVFKAFFAFHVEPGERPTTSEALSRFSLEPHRRPGGKVSYQNVNYMLLGAVLERVTGRPYVEDMIEHVLQPIGMNGGFECLRPPVAEHAATGYLKRFDMTGVLLRVLVPTIRSIIGGRAGRFVELRPYDMDCTPIGGLVTSVEDAAKFVQDQLAPESQLLSTASRRRMRELVGRGKAGIVSAAGTGLGWKLGDSPHGRYLNHEGGGPGFTAELRIYPKRNIGIALVINRMAMACGRAAHRLCETIVARQRSAG